MSQALGYLNWGRWVADCPQPGCVDARALYPQNPVTGFPSIEPVFDQVCANGHPFRIVMPPIDQAAAIEAEIRKRPYPSDQSWYPAGHVRAQQAGFPTGQTLAQLRDETVAVEELRASQQADRNHLVQVLAQHGVTVSPDGCFEGRL